MSRGSIDFHKNRFTDRKSNLLKTILKRGILASSLVLVFLGAQAVPTQVPTTKESDAVFEAKVRPTLQAKCVACHGPKQQIGGLRLDRPVPANLAPIIADAISYKGGLKMPPSGKLPADELAALTTWAKAGAPWPTAKPIVKPKGTFWAFVPPKTPALPKVKNKSWATNPLDAFILAELESKGLKPAPAADRRTLIRRATLDLTGLPPTPQEIDNFLADKQPNSFERLVDRLLASPAYGERWGRHWLDVARYADSNGLDENLVFVNAWRYRDWVIKSINNDKPISRFIQEQIAGDIIPGAGDDGIVATGYLAIGGKMLAEDDPVKQEMDIIDEQVDTLTKTFLGLTVGCARCHDHKFDPISAKDYYSMAAIFKSTKTMLNFRVVADWNERALGTKEEKDKVASIEAQVKAKTETADKKRKAASEVLLKELQPQVSAYEKAGRELIEAEKGKVELKPTISTPNGVAPADAIVLEAEDFVVGNVSKDKTGFGKGIGVLVNIGNFPNVTEYEVNVPTAGAYQLDLRYASNDSRPIVVYANGSVVLSNAAAKITGGFDPDHQQWHSEGIFMLNAGKNTIKFHRESYFPHIDKFLLISRPGQTPTDVLDYIAKKNNLIPEIVKDVSERIKNKIDIRIELPDKADHLFPAPISKELKVLGEEVSALNKSKPKLSRAMAVEEGKPTNLKVHLRGNYLTLGEPTTRRFPTVISEPNQPNLPENSSGRLELANWMTDGKNPLTARVFVNRVWRWRFGKGLVGSTDNFGALGELPSHPELLDWLATTFVKEDNWSLKKLHKRIMLTNTYQMSGQYDTKAANLDPDDRMLWRFPRKRLEAEAIRDSILSVAGTLDRKMGGSLMNFQPREYVTSTASSDPIDYNGNRRAVYLPVIRAALYDVYTAFDFGDPTVMNGDRSSTTVAPQALFMLNSKVMMNATKAMAESTLKKTGLSDSQRIRLLYLTCYGRPATDAEVTLSLGFLGRFQTAYAKAKDPRMSAWQSLCKSLIAANEFIYVE
ncbi:MAG: DUF1553 domain-containing protein [Armatimonadota bacterium]